MLNVLLFQARKCHGSIVRDDKLYVVGGTDFQKPVLTSEYLDLRKDLILSPMRDKITNEVNEDLVSKWSDFGGILPSWHNGSSGLIHLNSKLLAFSVYGTDHDKQYCFTNR